MSSRMPEILNNEKCPNKISLKIRRKKTKDIKKTISKKYMDLLLDISYVYESNLSLMQ